MDLEYKKTIINVFFWMLLGLWFPLVATGQPKVYIVFSTECPVGLNHVNDLKRLATEFTEVEFELLFSGTYFEEKEVAGFMVKYGLKDRLSWRVDENDKLIKELKARVMPCAFLISEEGAVVYSGKINDRPVRLGKVRPRANTRYLADAIKAVQNGVEPPIAKTEPVGCLLN